MKNPFRFLTTLYKPSRPQHRASIKMLVPDCPATSADITIGWMQESTEAINALIDFRSAVYQWYIHGQVPDCELMAEAARLQQANLGAWFDRLVATGLEASATEKEVCR